MLKKLLGLLGDAAIYGTSSALGRIIGLVLLPIYGRYLPNPEPDMGIVLMLETINLLFHPLANLGMTNAIFRRFSLEKDLAVRAEVLSTGLLSVCISSACLVALGCALTPLMNQWLLGLQLPEGLMRLTILSSGIAAIGHVPLATLRAARRVKTIAIISLTKLVISAGVSAWLVVAVSMGVQGIVIGWLVAEVAFTSVQFVVTWRDFCQLPGWATWRKMISYGLPFVPHHFQAVGLDALGRFAVTDMLGLDQAGLYGVANKCATPVTFIVNAIQNAWTAYKFQIHAENENPAEFFRSAITYYVAGISYLWIGVAVWGPELLRALMPPEFYPAAALVPAFALIPFAQGLYFMFGTGLEFTEKTRLFPVVSFVGLCIVAAATWLLVPPAGALGAALAMVIGWLAMATLIRIFAHKHFPIEYDRPRLFGLFALATAGGLLAYFDQSAGLGIRLAIAGVVTIVYPVLVLAILMTSRLEFGRIISLYGKLNRLLFR